MHKALYGTRSGEACWHDKLFDILHQMDFKPSKAGPDIWMKLSKDGTHHEYIAEYVDDLAICMQYPQGFHDTLKEKYRLKLKVLAQSVTTLDVDTPEMKMEPLLQTQENMLEKSLSLMKKCLEKNQRKLEHHW